MHMGEGEKDFRLLFTAFQCIRAFCFAEQLESMQIYELL